MRRTYLLSTKIEILTVHERCGKSALNEFTPVECHLPPSLSMSFSVHVPAAQDHARNSMDAASTPPDRGRMVPAHPFFGWFGRRGIIARGAPVGAGAPRRGR